ncbi:MAG: formate hydrogenlyase maturation HycH family protein [Yokenella regensburgei]|jgi:hydrogenase-4 component J|uniref:Formate hydrogenlyase maturation protein HycH n=1 Tax=Yokenella regensburgei TaxID=158877 RepID=A0AB38FUM6_9ENTR|nr:formate hydrogenlyase maturation HycH family protein [Yokenella regensburgei]EHM49066.1 formate hydrogenlyase maturation protein HycH [Yokenella regensburgei ATCC 43003]KAF1370338.1 hydrogenase-4 component J [Yokenella regensburgei]KFD23419.1 coenzyme F420 hydrogenase maturation protease [Yokenella regensburgei ATCC 49455]MDR3103853.1 formate hydrogenlyase maturation HycH family protein [Yokenella regensburgei]QIU90201.1 HycH family protein [Yokenella regensburgei]
MSDSGKVTFWSLRQKFVDSDEDMPTESQQVMYYSLAIGHHVGMIDCLKTELQCPLAGFNDWLALLPEGEGRRKLSGLLKFGEITIDSTHTSLLAHTVDALSKTGAEPFKSWSLRLIELLAEIEREPAIYLIVKRH